MVMVPGLLLVLIMTIALLLLPDPNDVEDCFCHPQVMMESPVAAVPAKACPPLCNR